MKNLINNVEEKNQSYVLITGASSGIGYEFVKQLFMKGYSVIIVSSNEAKLQNVYNELHQYSITNQMGNEVIKLVQDLSKPDGYKELYNKLTNGKIQVDILINNAGIGYAGEFIEGDRDTQEAMMNLNMNNLVLLTHCIANDMKVRGYGKILNVASNGAFQPGPYISTYYATKSFVLNFSLALRIELKRYGIIVSTLCPGATISDFARRAGKKQLKGSMLAADVARIGIHGLLKGKRFILPGLANKAALIIPRRLRTRAIAHMYKS